MPIIRALLSAITLFGGHLLNRRFDRVRLIGILLLPILLAAIGLIVWLARLPFGQFERFTFVSTLLGLPTLLLCALIVFSAVLTFRDARLSTTSRLSITQRVLGSTLSIVGALLASAVMLMGTSAFLYGFHQLTDEPRAPHELIWLNVDFGGGIDYSGRSVSMSAEDEIAAPPGGRERIRGRITLDGIGVAGVALDVTLNNQYEARGIETDARGIFEIRVPAGQWFINRIDVMQWDEKPRDRSVLLFSGHEPVAENRWYVNIGDYSAKGLEVTVPLPPDAMAVELELRDTIAVTWPPRTKPDGLAAAPDIPVSTLPSASIEWKPVKGASEYEVQITHMEHTFNSSRSDNLLRRRLSGTSLPLSSLPQRLKPEDAPPDDYEVEIYAFDSTGKLVTQSEAAGYDHGFRLTGAARIGKETFDSSGGPNPVVVTEEYEANERLLSQADELLDRKQLNEARGILDRVTQDAPAGRATASRGKLAALTGDCPTALRLFDQAEREGTCAPLEARELCPTKNK